MVTPVPCPKHAVTQSDPNITYDKQDSLLDCSTSNMHTQLMPRPAQQKARLSEGAAMEMHATGETLDAPESHTTCVGEQQGICFRAMLGQLCLEVLRKEVPHLPKGTYHQQVRSTQAFLLQATTSLWSMVSQHQQ